MASHARFDMGEMVFCTEDIFNDGGVPDMEEDGLIASAGTRGVVVNVGYVEADDRIDIYLVRFEQADGNLGPPVGCLVGELTQDGAVVC
ncbi:MAG: nitrogen fixation protein NifZ [Actinomycetota bacterium]